MHVPCAPPSPRNPPMGADPWRRHSVAPRPPRTGYRVISVRIFAPTAAQSSRSNTLRDRYTCRTSYYNHPEVWGPNAAHMSSTSTSTAAQPGGPVPDGLSSLVLSKRYLSCARPPHLYRLEHQNGTAANDPAAVADGNANNDNDDDDNNDDDDDEGCGWSSVGWCAPSPAVAAAVQARYEPSDVFTPLVFEEIRPATASASRSPPAPSSSSWMHHVQPQQQHCATGTGGLPHRRPLQHLSTLPSPAPPPPPPPDRQPQQPSAVSNKSTDPPHRNHHNNNNHHHHHQRHNDDGSGGNNKPGDLSWLVNFQVASIFESTASHGTAGRLFAGDWQEPETLKQQKKKSTKSEQKRKFFVFL